MQVQSYLFFNGRCEEAIEFYKKAVGAKVEMLMRFKESPQPQQPGMEVPGDKELMDVGRSVQQILFEHNLVVIIKQ